jgi:hemin uptake protein HemP
MPEPSREQRSDRPADVMRRPRVVRSEELFAGQRVVVIEHAGEQYRLITTRNNRLILQK